MDDFEKVLKLAEDEKVVLADSFKGLLHKWLHFGMTRYVCRNGTLSDGFEKITAAQRYAQCHREMWNRKEAIEQAKASAMEAQADLIEAQEMLEAAKDKKSELRAQAKLIKAKQILASSLISIEDTVRQIDEFNKIRLELRNEVETKYPAGIEQAEADNWAAVAKFRVGLENATGQPQMLRHVPLDKDVKAEMGIELNKPELSLWKAIEQPHEFNRLFEEKQAKLQLERK